MTDLSFQFCSVDLPTEKFIWLLIATNIGLHVFGWAVMGMLASFIKFLGDVRALVQR